MNESPNKGQAGEAIFVVLFLFVIIFVLVYKFAYNKDTVTNYDLGTETSDSKEEVINRLDGDQQNQTFNKYAKQIFSAKQESQNANVDNIIAQYSDELKLKTAIPEHVVTLQDVSSTYARASYKTDFERLFAELKEKGGTEESQIFSMQIVDKDTLIPLSDDDKETLLRSATDYEIFAKKVIALKTPTVYQDLAKGIALRSLNISYILKQMINEPDNKIYSLWISKYMENMSVIITSRYALQK